MWYAVSTIAWASSFSVMAGLRRSCHAKAQRRQENQKQSRSEDKQDRKHLAWFEHDIDLLLLLCFLASLRLCVTHLLIPSPARAWSPCRSRTPASRSPTAGVS